MEAAKRRFLLKPNDQAAKFNTIGVEPEYLRVFRKKAGKSDSRLRRAILVNGTAKVMLCRIVA
jgi:hypothetical protein